MKKKIDLDNWSRKEHFEFFNKFEEPYYSVVVNVDVTKAYSNAKEQGLSFFLYYLHCALSAVNQVESFKYRVEGTELFLYDKINVSPTVDRADGSFGFGFIEFEPELKSFVQTASATLERLRAATGLFSPNSDRQDVIHFSALPWLNFTGLTHARSFTWRDSVPKVSVGKVTEDNGRKLMPVSVTVHHGLTDGRHVGEFVELFQQWLDQ
ncbi:chloramphenicol acetyltransferase [Mucilaginibacter terrenus]|uniref:Chloramphenicol acetyltransferase n=1 Tax=Mucilaginibacter terrenus TaxID=2482727 RepID=A0A3E2NTJ2_9SPHI|nr:chloramphenicol acetyltransferase [Mucilaginibacter terrenus]RFZ84333.1 chloramphenicol acetyltransferase [Mucilaginibacter terrenus]